MYDEKNHEEQSIENNAANTVENQADAQAAVNQEAGQNHSTTANVGSQENQTVNTSSESNQTTNAHGSQEYRYGRSYYQNQQDSVYHTRENTQHSNTNVYGDTTSPQGQSSHNYSGSQGNQTSGYGSSYQQPHYQTYTTGNYTQSTNEVQKVKKERKPLRDRMWFKTLKVVACIALIAAVGTGSSFATVKYMEQKEEDSESATTKTTSNIKTTTAYPISTVSASTAVVTDVSDVVEKTMPSLVKITNVGTQSYSTFFGQGGTYEYESNGSGIIIGQTDTELLIVTNQHVVSGADKLKVIFIDEESVEANVKGTDVEKDLAVIAVPVSSVKDETLGKIKVATLGDSNALNVGEPAIAIGNALGYGQSVTLGVISAKGREVTTENGTNTLIQTDAAINPGNSGGALMNIAGEVIGINSVKYSSTEVEGMGYAIPITDATPIIDELMSQETKIKVDKDKQAYLGISGVDITSDIAQTYNMPQGVYVAEVEEDGPSEKAGIRKGDIITKIAGVSITSFDELKAELEYHEAGSTVEIEILTQPENSYGYESKTVEVTLAKKED